MDTHAHLHLITGDFEGGLAGLGHDAGSQCGTNGAAAIGGLLADPGDLIEIGLGFCFRSGNFECVNHAGDATALLAFCGRRARDVIGQYDTRGVQVLHLKHVAGHIEIHDVAAVIAVEPQHAGAAIGRANGIRRREWR